MKRQDYSNEELFDWVKMRHPEGLQYIHRQLKLAIKGKLAKKNVFLENHLLEDILGETVLRMFEICDKLQGDNEHSNLFADGQAPPFFAYFTAVGLRVYQEQKRKMNKYALVGDSSLPHAAPETEQTLYDQLNDPKRLLIWEYIKNLPDDHRQPLEWRFLKGLSDQQIADKMGIQRNTVANRRKRLLDRIKAYLKNRK
ncbi:MAG: sigma-70 family RNA polymerase sigma factor [Bacteroidota bacterium]